MTRLYANSMLSLTLALGSLMLAACSSAMAATVPTGTATAGSSAASSPVTANHRSTQSASGGCGTAGVAVSTASGLRSALANAQPGETILLAPGTYSGQFEATRSGSNSAPITLCGPSSAVLNGAGISIGYTFYLNKASWWQLEGFTVAGGQKGVLADAASHDLISGLYVHDIGDEAIHLRDFSSYDTVSGNVIRNTGLLMPFYGEGIYVGSAYENWCQYSHCQPDGSNHDVIAGNDIAATTAENVDIKEGTAFGIISGNQFNGAGTNPSSATSWVNVKGNDWTVTGNTGIDSNQDGFSVHQVYPGWGIGNVFTANQATVNGPGYGIDVASINQLMAVVSCSNTATGAQSGLSNIPCTPA